MKKLKINPLVPFGVEIISDSEDVILDTLSPKDIVDLLNQYKMVLFRGFYAPNKDELSEFSKSIGPLLEWEFGHVMEMKSQDDAKNYLFTQGHVPFHWDGAFYQAPRYLVFHCIDAPDTNAGGETLFCNTTALWESVSDDEKNEWKKITIYYETEKLAHYGGKISVPMVQKHPQTDEAILRFAEPVPTTMLNPVSVTVADFPLHDSDAFINDLALRCYQPDNCYTHTWSDNDLLLVDNFSLIHARHSFTKSSKRHLRRIQIL